MNNKMMDLADALSSLHALPARVSGDVLFVGQWGVHCSITGTVQARNVHDSHERFTVGKFSDPSEAIAAKIAELP